MAIKSKSPNQKVTVPQVLFWTLLTSLVTIFLAIAWIIFSNYADPLGVLADATWNDFFVYTFSIIIEALPFVILGVTISVLIHQFIRSDQLMRWLPKNTVLRRIIISFLGIFMPVCECGNVPVARSFIAKGMKVPEASLFLLAAPVLNPITLFSTYKAFGFDDGILVWRMVGAFVIANIAAIIVSRTAKQKQLLDEKFALTCETHSDERGLQPALNLFRREMWTILRMLILGAIIAGATQVFIPRSVLETVGSDPIWSVVAMLALAFIVSICSSVDAFFALAYARIFTSGSIIAFLIAGPMVDIKMLSIMRTTFTRRTLAVISLVVLTLTFILGVFINAL